jgi:hypothetical protein
VRLFGSWRSLLAGADIAPAAESVAKMKSSKPCAVTAPRAVVLPTAREWTRRAADHPPTSTVVLRFGSWSAATRAATVPN